MLPSQYFEKVFVIVLRVLKFLVTVLYHYLTQILIWNLRFSWQWVVVSYHIITCHCNPEDHSLTGFSY